MRINIGGVETRIEIGNTPIRLLGLFLDQLLSFDEHARRVANSVAADLATLERCVPFITRSDTYTLFQSHILSTVKSALGAWFHRAYNTSKSTVDVALNNACRFITGIGTNARNEAVALEAGTFPLSVLAQLEAAMLGAKVARLPGAAGGHNSRITVRMSSSTSSG